MVTRKNKDIINPQDPAFEALVAGIMQIIRRPQLSHITAKQAYDILHQFREQFLSEAERQLDSNAKQALWADRVTTLGLSGHDAGLDEVIAVLAVPARHYALSKISANSPVTVGLDERGYAVLAMAWGTIDRAKRESDTVAKQVAEHLHQAIYAVVPAQNRLKAAPSSKKGRGG
jgi:hypothetical protein